MPEYSATSNSPEMSNKRKCSEYDSDEELVTTMMERLRFVRNWADAYSIAQRVISELIRSKEYFQMPAAKENRLEKLVVRPSRTKSIRALYDESKNTIFMSLYLLAGKGARVEDLENTVLHECAHAVIGVKGGHGKAWRTFFQKIGGTGERCGGAMEVEFKWTLNCVEKRTGACANQGRHIRASRKYLETHRCKCGGRLQMSNSIYSK